MTTKLTYAVLYELAEELIRALPNADLDLIENSEKRFHEAYADCNSTGDSMELRVPALKSCVDRACRERYAELNPIDMEPED